MATSMKAPPIFDEDTNYEHYKKEVEIWKILIGDDLEDKQLGTVGRWNKMLPLGILCYHFFQRLLYLVHSTW